MILPCRNEQDYLDSVGACLRSNGCFDSPWPSYMEAPKKRGRETRERGERANNGLEAIRTANQ